MARLPPKISNTHSIAFKSLLKRVFGNPTM